MSILIRRIETAPLYFRKEEKKKNENVLQSMTQRLLDAIDENNFENIEKVISQMLDNNVSELYIHKFCHYAYSKHKEKACEYLKHILLINNNTYNVV